MSIFDRSDELLRVAQEFEKMRNDPTFQAAMEHQNRMASDPSYRALIEDASRRQNDPTYDALLRFTENKHLYRQLGCAAENA